jgi:anti-sigma regulatory factor (Ser/Thr protein kinase)
VGEVLSNECQIQSDPVEIEIFCNLVEDVLAGAGVDVEIIGEVVVSTDEATTNIIMHAYENCHDKPIRLKLDVDQHEISVTLMDKGVSFNIDNVKKADLSGTIEERQIGGLGIYLMRQFMDTLSYSAAQDENEWNILTMKRSY